MLAEFGFEDIDCRPRKLARLFRREFMRASKALGEKAQLLGCADTGPRLPVTDGLFDAVAFLFVSLPLFAALFRSMVRM